VNVVVVGIFSQEERGGRRKEERGKERIRRGGRMEEG